MGVYQYLDNIHRSLDGVGTPFSSSSSACVLHGALSAPDRSALPIDFATFQIIQNATPGTTAPIVLRGVSTGGEEPPNSGDVRSLENLKECLLNPSCSAAEQLEAFYKLPVHLQKLFETLIPGLASKGYHNLLSICDTRGVPLLDQVIHTRNLALQVDTCVNALTCLKWELSAIEPNSSRIHSLLEVLHESRFQRYLYLPLLNRFKEMAGDRFTFESCQSILRLQSPLSREPMLDELIAVLGLMQEELFPAAMVERLSHFDFFYGDQSPIEPVEEARLDPLRFAPVTPEENPFRIAMISYELAVHGVKYGGLGEAVYGLSRGLVDQGNQVSIFTPKFDVLADRLDWSEAEIIPFTHVFNGALKADRCYHKVFNGLHVYYLEEGSPEPGQAHYAIGDGASIYRDSSPNYYGLHKRIAYFSSSAMGLLNRLQDEFNIAVIHDWHGAVALPSFPTSGMRLMLVIHNNHYQGVLEGASSSISGFCGNDPKGTNVLLNGIQKADQIIGVSSKFAKEMQTVLLGAGISPWMRKAALQGRLSGITNGGNPELWDPASHAHLKDWVELERTTDGKVQPVGKKIDLNYSAEDLDLVWKKRFCKEQLQLALEYYYPSQTGTFGLDLSGDRPLYLFIGRYESCQKGLDKFLPAYRLIHSLGGAFITVGVGEDSEGTRLLDQLEQEVASTRGNAWITRGGEDNFSLKMQKGDFPGIPPLGGLIRAAADCVFCPSSFEPCGLVQFEAWLFGSLVIGTDTGGLGTTIQTNPELPGFNGFTFPRSDWESEEQTELLLREIEKAHVFWNAKNPEEKQNLMRAFMCNAQESNWRVPVQKYERVFAQILRESRPLAIDPKVISITSSLELPLLSSKTDRFYPETTRLYEAFGARVIKNNKGDVLGARFQVLAPNALSVQLLVQTRSGEKLIPMSGSQGIWKVECPGIGEGCVYEYIVEMPNGQKMRKSDPFAFGSTLRPAHASVVRDPAAFPWSDTAWMQARNEKEFGKFPLSIYEVHLGSFLERDEGKFPNYRDLAHSIATHCDKMGYTHIEIFGLLEHPSDESLGYQISSLFSSTGRFGTLQDFQYFVDHMHQKGIGVILDWTPYHFATNSTALGKFDGHPLYENSDPKKGIAANNWKTYLFDYSKEDVRNFVLSSARYACEHWHIDGFRVDAAGHLIELDKDGARAHLNPHGIEFLKQFNQLIHTNYPGVFTVAESWDAKALDTLPLHQGGLGFDAAWTVASQSLHALLPMNDAERAQNYGALAGIAADHFYCPVSASAKRQVMHTLSHDEFGDISLYQKSGKKKRANTLLMLSTIMLSPSWGYLLFMGLDYGKEAPWDHKTGLNLVESKSGKHKKVRKMVKDLNQIYKQSPAFWNPEGFEWVKRNDPENAVVAYHKKSSSDAFLVVHNYSTHGLDPYPITYESGSAPPENTRLVEIFNTDSTRYGGKGGHANGTTSTAIKVAPLSTVLFRYDSC